MLLSYQKVLKSTQNERRVFKRSYCHFYKDTDQNIDLEYAGAYHYQYVVRT